MAHGHDPNEKIVYVGDSRVRQRTNHDHRTPRDYSAYPGKSEAFIPNFLLKEWMVAVVFLVGVLVLTMTEPAPLGYPADPATPGYIPMPDWYFLFLYQFLKYPYASNDFVVVGTIVVPAIMFGGLLLAPFLDTGKERRFYRRPIASSLMLLSVIACGYLTWVSWDHYQHELKEKGIIPEHIKREEEMHAEKAAAGGGEGKAAAPKKSALVAADDPAHEIYKKSTCIQCHAAELKGKIGPSLVGVGDKMDKAKILDIIKNGTASKAMGPQVDANKAAGLTDADLDKLAEWLAKQKKAQ